MIISDYFDQSGTRDTRSSRVSIRLSCEPLSAEDLKEMENEEEEDEECVPQTQVIDFF